MTTGKNTIYRAVRSLFSLAGLNVTFDRPLRNAPKLLAIKIAELGVGAVLDIGANSGQFVQELRDAGYQGKIVSFEPLPSVHEVLCCAARTDSNWIVAPRVALGDTPGRTRINISKNLASSSLLKVSKRSIDAEPESDFSGVSDVEIKRLDDLIDPAWPKCLALKLDTQGFEMHVLRGATETLKNTALIIVEMSLVPLYDGGASFVELYRFLEDRGFCCIDILQGFADHMRNELLQVDGVFVRI